MYVPFLLLHHPLLHYFNTVNVNSNVNSYLLQVLLFINSLEEESRLGLLELHHNNIVIDCETSESSQFDS